MDHPPVHPGRREAELLPIKAGINSILNGPNGLPLEEITGGGSTYYYHQDQIGSTIALSDSTGAEVQTYAYDPYGNLTSSSGSIANAFQFQGQFLDSTSDLYNMRARWFDPVISQFVTRDKLVRTTRTAYSFADDTPVNVGDPSGLWCLLGFIGNTCSFGNPRPRYKVTVRYCNDETGTWWDFNTYYEADVIVHREFIDTGVPCWVPPAPEPSPGPEPPGNPEPSIGGPTLPGLPLTPPLLLSVSLCGRLSDVASRQ